ncbi:MAG: hypothetical protein V7750_09665 [Sneathiella sp.]
MLNKQLNNYSVMGFATFQKKRDVETMDVIAASLDWQREFLKSMDGIGFHCLLGNMSGGFADIIFATDRPSFDKMGELHFEAPSSIKFMSLLDPESIQLRSASILKEGLIIPSGFSCIEAGFMTLAEGAIAEDEEVRLGSDKIEEQYLGGYSNTLGHFVGRAEDQSYCEITFGQTLGQTREICYGYEHSVICQDFLNQFDEKKFEFDFWVPLA